ncbi:hypothetical protein L0156_02300 [bacterium]|nr:hypothetical protein [bacterium]
MLENDKVITESELLTKLRGVVGARSDEMLQLILNSIFVGIIREEARIHPSTLKRESLDNLLRQAVVSACTAYETYLSTLLGEHIHDVIDMKGADFFPSDKDVTEYFKGLSLPIGEAFRLLNDEESSVFLGRKIVSYVQNKNLGSVNGLKTVGLLLGLKDPWTDVGARLNRKAAEVTKVVGDCLQRRNDIVHRSDRVLNDESGTRQPIAFSWTSQAVDTTRHVCLALDEIVAQRLIQLREEFLVAQKFFLQALDNPPPK